MGLFCSNSRKDETNQQQEVERARSLLDKNILIPILVEIVSARDLSIRKTIDPYCIVRCGSKEVHRTKTIYNDPDPIWTVLTGSLCLVNLLVPDEMVEEKDLGQFSVVVEVCDGSQCLGVVSVPYQEVLQAKGERQEYPIKINSPPAPSSFRRDSRRRSDRAEDMLGATISLRFRRATAEDVEFFDASNVESNHGGSAGDINFKTAQRKSIMTKYKRIDKHKNRQNRVQPYPDPSRVDETTWMTKKELEEEALKPSKKWVEAGYGGVGRVYVEIIGCDKLPNLDIGLDDKTDAFVGLVFEDTMVRTDIIHDSLNPRWMPWSTRAFAFNIAHPSSMLFLGVFDFDAMKDHDPVGRVVINTANFQSNTSYLLQYTLHDDPTNEDFRGNIIIRLRVEWKSESEARKMALGTIPPQFLINVERERPFRVLRYICHGKVNMDKPTIKTCKLYANELMSYSSVVFYIIDVILGILLWRGRAKLSLGGSRTLSVWFPIHSVVLLVAVVVSIERPFLIPSVLLYGIAWILLTINYHGSRYPYPWYQCKSAGETNMVLILGRPIHLPVFVKPNVGVHEAKKLEDLDKVKADRVAGFLNESQRVGLKVLNVYNKSSMESYSIQTQDRGWSFLSNHLTVVHAALKSICMPLRSARNLVNWRGYYAHSLTIMCIVAATAWLVLPLHLIVLWMTRIVVWTFLGPWMKLVDIFWVHQYYRTREELETDPKYEDKLSLDWILTSEFLHKLGASARVASEDALKLKDMRQYKFGKLSQRVPPVDLSRFPSVPLPSSTAQPYSTRKKRGCYQDMPSEEQEWHYVSGQKLQGNMIPTLARKSDVSMEF